MLVLKGLVGLHRTIQLQLLQGYWWGIGLDYCDIELFVLKQTEIILLFLGLHPSTAFWTFFPTISATPFLLREMLCVAVVYWAERPFYKKKSGFMVLIFECQQL